jgi:soluble lytic murein transglycosylase
MGKRGIFVATATFGLLLIGVFQNMSLVEFNELNISDVDDAARQEQARELLGAYYDGSFAQKLEGQQYLNYLLFKTTDEMMKPRYKDRVPALVQTVISDSQEYSFDPVFILAVMKTESSFNPDAVGSAGEIGLMQILPRTAEWIAKKYDLPWRGPESLHDPVTNAKIGIRYFDTLREKFGRIAYHYLPAYNMGPKNMRRVERTLGNFDAHGRVQKREYAVRVMKNYFSLYQEIVAENQAIERLANAEDTPSNRSRQ